MTLFEALILIFCIYVLSVSIFYAVLLVLYIERRRVVAAIRRVWAFLEAVEGRGA